MRIIGGEFSGLSFHPPMKKWPTRPTTELSKESLYNILQNRLDFRDMIMLDLFGGTGNHSFQCISLGCKDVTYVDSYKPAANFVKQQAKLWNIESMMKVICSDVRRFIDKDTRQYSYIFADPPYQLSWLDEIPNILMKYRLLQDGGLLVIEHDHQYNFSEHPRLSEFRKYGQTYFSFFK